ncbi:hypothetical protein ELI_05005 [Erythrobacter litoralis HTCC2594]|uniref:Flp family type IVb pilin n=1 Tax=Erythrobacter litoralis (strain HTCC2594) TaxID=314225 RepID=Q2NB48_ERYLH|nr:hypothetical protein ELI_05005 [Erythrobacter litoralis HTCC2594]
MESIVRKLITSLLQDEAGATAVEYGLILALVFLAMVAAVQGVGNETVAMWDHVSSTSQQAIDQSGV